MLKHGIYRIFWESKKKFAINLPEGWILSNPGKEYIKKLINKNSSSRKVKAETDLRELVKNIPENEVKNYVSEAILCLEADALRASTIMIWQGAVALLHKSVVENNLPEFNLEARRRNPKWKDAVNSDGLGFMKESVFLDILVSLSIMQKNVKNKLKHCLDDRNSCGHPNSYRIGEAQVAAHIEFLILNVFSKY